MITPLDIQTKTFSNGAIGYKKSEVDEFLAQVLKDYEELYRGNNDKKETIKSLEKLLESYKGMEETMKNTLVVAQSSAEQLTSAARNEADTIVSEAKQKSQEIIAKAQEQLSNLTAGYEQLKKEMEMFVMHSKSDFEVHIKALEKMNETIKKSSI